MEKKMQKILMSFTLLPQTREKLIELRQSEGLAFGMLLDKMIAEYQSETVKSEKK